MNESEAELEKRVEIRFEYLEKLLDERFEAQEKAIELKTQQTELSSKNSVALLGIFLVGVQIFISLVIHFMVK